ncbi:hypothetical protein BDFB_003664 [Asbolus verrucosus]|uniref:Uncharacterized protein n=1 Tax=Asbolus verrucosus TaxID=1661398 RepID=A0A482W8J7_ASBVE|nr:hypothetical protein BDFB_003664 [Asbolus verrucosus]
MVTLDRILYLANPLTRRKPKLCHAYVARRIMVVCFIVSAAMNIPYFFIFESDEQGQVRTRAFYYSK